MAFAFNTQAESAQEGFFRKLSYVFASDFKCAAKIDELEKKLRSMSTEDEKTFLETKIDFGCQDYKSMIKILDFAFLALKWSKANLPKIEELLKGFFGPIKNGDEVRNMLFNMVDVFKKKLPMNFEEYENLTDGKLANGTKLEKGKSLKELGYNKTIILSIIKVFKANASGQLNVMNHLSGIIDDMADDGYAIYTDIEDIGDIFNQSIDCYKYVDYFLFFLNKEI